MEVGAEGLIGKTQACTVTDGDVQRLPYIVVRLYDVIVPDLVALY